MNWSFLLMGILPLLFFVIVDSFAGPKAALFTAIILAVGEAIFSFYLFGEIDSLTIFSLILVVVLAAVAFQRQNSLYFKFQPVILSAILGIILLTSYLINEPLLVSMATKYKDFFPPEQQQLVTHPQIIKMFEILTLNSAFAFFGHALVTAYAAWKLSNWWWIAIRGIGFYLFAFLSVIASRMML